MGIFGSENDSKDAVHQYKNRCTDKQIECPHCGGTAFQKREAQLNTSILTAMDLDFLNHSATVLACDTCGHIEWFLRGQDLERTDW